MKTHHTCPTCGGTKLVKNGFRYQRQCLKCKACGRQFIIEKNDVFVSDVMKEQILRSLLERNSMRSICRIFRVSVGWLYRFMLEHLEQMSEDLKLHVTAEMLSEDADFEVDELCTYVRNKKAKVWVWIVYHRQSKQIVAFHMGCRGIKTCKKLWRKLQEIGIKGRLHTDLWKAYATVFPKDQHVPHEKRGATNHIERFNGTLRSRLSRLVRKTYSFAKSYRNLFLSLRFFITNYNLSLL